MIGFPISHPFSSSRYSITLTFSILLVLIIIIKVCIISIYISLKTIGKFVSVKLFIIQFIYICILILDVCILLVFPIWWFICWLSFFSFLSFTHMKIWLTFHYSWTINYLRSVVLQRWKVNNCIIFSLLSQPEQLCLSFFSLISHKLLIVGGL